LPRNTAIGTVSLPPAFDKLYSPQMVPTVNTTKHTIENHLTKKREKRKKKKHTYTQTNSMYLSKAE